MTEFVKAFTGAASGHQGRRIVWLYALLLASS